METVLGLSITSSGAGWVVLDGAGVGPASLDHDVVVVAGADDRDISRHIGAVRSAQAIAAVSGQELKAIGLTWTDDAAATASLVRNALLGLGFHKVVSVRLADVGADAALTLAREAALAVRSGIETDTLRLPQEPPATVAQTSKQPWSRSSARAAVVLVGGVVALFVAGPALAGQPESRPADSPQAVDASVPSASIHAVPVPPSAAPPIAETIQLVVRRPEPVTASVRPEPAAVVAGPNELATEVVAVQVPVPQAPAVPAAISAAPAAPLPAMAAAPPPPDPAQLVFSPLLSALP